MSDKQKVPVFPLDKIVEVKISGGFYTRLSQLLISYSKQHEMKDLIQFMEEMKTREPKTEFEYHLMTLLTLLSSIEKSAADQKVIELRDLPDNTEEKPLES